MTTLFYILIFTTCVVVLFFSSRLIIHGVDHFSKHTKVSSFATSVLLLGVITSFSEMSVGINAILTHNPAIFVGNLIGASFVILIGILPLLAIFSGGIELHGHLDQRRLLFFLVLILAPSFLVLDGHVGRYDALLLILLYGLFFAVFQMNEPSFRMGQMRVLEWKPTVLNIVKIVIGAVIIYGAGKYLVESAEYFAQLLKVPQFIVSVFMLSIGTNLPELSIAWNSILKKHTEIAFGDYVGSAAANPLLFGVLTLINGPFDLNITGFDYSFLFIVFGYVVFFLFARSKKRITVYEAMILLVIYIAFGCYQISEILFLSPTL